VLPNISPYRFRFESALSPNPDGGKSPTVDNPLHSALRDIQMIRHLLRRPKAFGVVLTFLKSSAERLNLILKVSGTLLKFLDAVLGTGRTVRFVFGAAGI
jgi:hypothetical protein